MSRRGSLLLAVGLCMSLFNVTARAEETYQVTVYRKSLKGKPTHVIQKSRSVIVRSRTPHRQLNPEGLVSAFEGVQISRLLGLTQKDRSKLVHFVAKDEYVSTVPASVLIDSQAILAFKENGNPIEDRRGGLQVIFPTEEKVKVPEIYLKKAAFWCWYVKSIVVGDLSEGGLRPSKGRKLSNAMISRFDFVPPSVFQVVPVSCPRTIRVPFSVFQTTRPMNAEFLNGSQRELNPEEFELVLGEGMRPLPVHCGGPYALVASAKLATLSQPLLAKNLLLNYVGAYEGRARDND